MSRWPKRLVAVAAFVVVAAAAILVGEKFFRQNDATAARVAVMAQVLQLIEDKAVGYRAVGWPDLEKRALDRAASANRSIELYSEIKRVLAALDDGGHSFALSPDQWRRIQANASDQAGDTRRDEGELVALVPRTDNRPRAMLITVPPHSAIDETSGRRLSVRLSRQLDRVAATKPCGVIVDLRATGGGNMWPGLVGLRAVIDPQHMGSIVDRDGRALASYREQALRAFAADLGADSLPLGALSPMPMAILIGSGTISASEAMAVFLRARPGTVLIGQPTAGHATTNEMFSLNDGGALVLATARLANPNGKAIEGPIKPDIETDVRSGADALNRALDWLGGLPQCPS